MEETYQLVFRGEILDGQHRAVVKRRLVESLKLNEAQADKLFAGSPVVLKKSADAKTAAGFQALFKKAGARLRVHALATDKTVAAETAPAAVKAPAVVKEPAAVEVPATAQEPASAEPPAFLLLTLEEIDQLVATRVEPSFEISAPDFSVAEPGVVLQETRETIAVTLPEVEFSVADVGADLLDQPLPVEAVEIGPLTFELAELGATIGDDQPKPVPQAPDTSHLRIAEEA